MGWMRARKGRPRIAEAMRIRKVHASDRAALVEMIRATENLTREEKDCAVELLDIYLTDPLQKDYYFVAAADPSDSPAGYICYGKAPLTDAVYDMYWILVDRRSRGKGVGAKLLAHAEELIRDEGARMLVAETSGLPSYQDARRFYLKNGYTEEARIKEFYKPGDDKVIYIKRF